MEIIIRVPSVFACKIPGGEWINLAEIRRLQLDHDQEVPVLRVTWANGESFVYRGIQASAILAAWETATTIDKSDMTQITEERSHSMS